MEAKRGDRPMVDRRIAAVLRMQSAGVRVTLDEYQEKLPTMAVEVMDIIAEGRDRFERSERVIEEAKAKGKSGRR